VAIEYGYRQIISVALYEDDRMYRTVVERIKRTVCREAAKHGYVPVAEPRTEEHYQPETTGPGGLTMPEHWMLHAYVAVRKETPM
jgi:hypothetical protein